MNTSTPGGYKALDFDNAVYNYRPGLAPQDSRLPPNYTQLLPEAAMAAFKAAKFEWGKVPQFVPPVEVRVKHVAQALFS
jgi:nucleoporin NUP42